MDPKSYWDAIEKVKNGLTGHHEQATIIKMVSKFTRKLAKNAKENAKILAENFEHHVFNRTVESSFKSSLIDEFSQLLTKDHISTTPTSKELRTIISEMANRKSPR